MRTAFLASVMLLGAATNSLLAQQATPDPATITVPTLHNQRDSKVFDQGWKYFYFHRVGVSYEEAYADLLDCYRFLSLSQSWTVLPSFAPWSTRVNPNGYQPMPMYEGLLIDAIAPALQATQNRRARQSRLRRCLEPRGYLRYPLTETDWKLVVADFSPTALAVQAKLASGPIPDAEPLAPNK